MKLKIKKIYAQIQEELKENPKSLAVYLLLRFLVLVTMVLQFLNGNYESVFICVLTLFLLLIPAFIQSEFKIELPTLLEVIILLFIFMAEILGEIHSFYIIIPYWDTILHTMNGFLAAAVGFSLVDLMNQSDKIKFHLSPLFLALVAFCFSMTIGVLWEFFEYFMDSFFMMDTQKDTIITSIHSVLLDPTLSNTPVHINNISEVIIDGAKLPIQGYIDIGLIDTMGDLIVNFIGAVVFSVIGYFYVKNRKGNNFLSKFIPTKKNK